MKSLQLRLRWRVLRRQREVECGVHELSFILPPDAPQYEAEIYIVHIDGALALLLLSRWQRPAALRSWVPGPAASRRRGT